MWAGQGDWSISVTCFPYSLSLSLSLSRFLLLHSFTLFSLSHTPCSGIIVSQKWACSVFYLAERMRNELGTGFFLSDPPSYSLFSCCFIRLWGIFFLLGVYGASTSRYVFFWWLWVRICPVCFLLPCFLSSSEDYRMFRFKKKPVLTSSWFWTTRVAFSLLTLWFFPPPAVPSVEWAY